MPGESAARAYTRLRAKLALLREALRTDTSDVPSPARKEASVLAGPASPSLDAVWAWAAGKTAASAAQLLNPAARSRIEKPTTPALRIVRDPRPAEISMGGLVGHRTHAMESPRTIDTGMAQEIVRRHLGVSLTPMPNCQPAPRLGRSVTIASDGKRRGIG
jgi:hypothetical protein